MFALATSLQVGRKDDVLVTFEGSVAIHKKGLQGIADKLNEAMQAGDYRVPLLKEKTNAVVRGARLVVLDFEERPMKEIELSRGGEPSAVLAQITDLLKQKNLLRDGAELHVVTIDD